jgi:hypothetical protein
VSFEAAFLQKPMRRHELQAGALEKCFRQPSAVCDGRSSILHEKKLSTDS